MTTTWACGDTFCAITLALGLAACSTTPTPDAGTCEHSGVFVAAPRGLSSEGDVLFRFVRRPASDGLAMSLKIVEAGGAGRDFGRQAFGDHVEWSIPIDAGDVNVELTFTCAQAAPAVVSLSLHVYPRVHLTEAITRVCLRLRPAGLGAFDCDGVVVGLDGAPLPGRLVGTSRGFWTDAGWGRWVQTDAGLQLETSNGTPAPVQVAPADHMVVTEHFAFMPGVVVRYRDGGLDQSSIDAGPELDGPDFVPCAASESDGQEWVSWCLNPFLHFFSPPPGDDPFVSCELMGSGVGNCSFERGVFVRQDLRTQEVILRQPLEFVRFHPSRPAQRVSRPVRPDELTWRPSTLETGDGRQGRMSNGEGTAGFLAPDPSLETFTLQGLAPQSTSELVWAVQGDAGVTRFARLRPEE